MTLGEIGSKCDHIAGVPLAPDVAEKIHQLYLTKGALATTAIEGNTLSEEEAGQIISGKLKLPPSQEYLAQEIKNICHATNEITKMIYENGKILITVELLKYLNSMVLEKLEVDEDVVPGKIREHSVVVGRYRCAPPQDCDYLLEKMCETLNNFPCPDNAKAAFNVIKAVYAHLYFVWIHPFGDGNGRTARLIELCILMSAGFAQPTTHLLSNYYNRTRNKYYEALDRAVESEDQVVAFIKYSATGLAEGLREQIAYIREQQWRVAWINYIHKEFEEKNSPTDVRRRKLVLCLSEMGTVVPVNKISILTPELSIEYHLKTPKTVIRDVNALIEMGLIERRRGGIVANREKILAFLPWRNRDETSESKAAD
ncbi:Fic family protein [Skermanella aerolata]|nr:Fic family protein [Skermanella aerolata]